MASSTYKFYRILSALSDDTDYAGTQSETGLVVVRAAPCRGYGSPVKVEFMAEYRSAADAVVARASGTFSVQMIRRMQRPAFNSNDGGSSKTIGGSALVDSASLTGQTAHRPIVGDEVLPGDEVGLRFHTFASSPVGATQLWVYYREIDA